MRRLLGIIMIVAAIGATIVSCSSERRYSRWENLPEEGWAYGDTLWLMPLDTMLLGNDSLVNRPLMLGLAHSNSYPYSNLWLEVTYHGDGYYYRDTVNVSLADVYGRWLGRGVGATFQHQVLLNRHADIDLSRPVEVRHIMRVDTLRGIDRIGIEVQ